MLCIISATTIAVALCDPKYLFQGSMAWGAPRGVDDLLTKLKNNNTVSTNQDCSFALWRHGQDASNIASGPSWLVCASTQHIHTLVTTTINTTTVSVYGTVQLYLKTKTKTVSSADIYHTSKTPSQPNPIFVFSCPSHALTFAVYHSHHYTEIQYSVLSYGSTNNIMIFSTSTQPVRRLYYGTRIDHDTINTIRASYTTVWYYDTIIWYYDTLLLHIISRFIIPYDNIKAVATVVLVRVTALPSHTFPSSTPKQPESSRSVYHYCAPSHSGTCTALSAV